MGASMLMLTKAFDPAGHSEILETRIRKASSDVKRMS